VALTKFSALSNHLLLKGGGWDFIFKITRNIAWGRVTSILSFTYPENKAKGHTCRVQQEVWILYKAAMIPDNMNLSRIQRLAGS
jgi:hypothetical protein